MPKEIEEYVQKIGRTGRLGNEGKATSFFDFTQDYALIEPIIKTFISVINLSSSFYYYHSSSIIF